MKSRNLPKQLSDFYSDRKGPYKKAISDEIFLKELNEKLLENELKYYQKWRIHYPFIFIFGPPRSGTTLLTQVIAHSLDIGYINNFAARFYLAPLHGLRLSDMILGKRKKSDFQSDFAHTHDPADIHEFGYFWRYWLKKEDISGITNSEEVENEIDWDSLKKVLSNIQGHFNKGIVFKNIFGSYHLSRLYTELKKVIYVYINRDLTDAAVSILGARRKYYKDLNTWWSYMPKEYPYLKEMDYMHQIAGQVYYLTKYYDSETANLDNVIHITYSQLVNNPMGILNRINVLSKNLFDYEFKIESPPPGHFPFKTYPESSEKKLFQELINRFEKKSKQGMMS
jgi:hypothetical protein